MQGLFYIVIGFQCLAIYDVVILNTCFRFLYTNHQCVCSISLCGSIIDGGVDTEISCTMPVTVVKV